MSCAQTGRSRAAPKRRTPILGGDGYFAFGEYTHGLRLASKLSDLRPGCANPCLRTSKISKRHGVVSCANRAIPCLLQRESPPQSGWAFSLEQATGIEPAASAWEAEVLPLDYACVGQCYYIRNGADCQCLARKISSQKTTPLSGCSFFAVMCGQNQRFCVFLWVVFSFRLCYNEVKPAPRGAKGRQ